MNEGLSGSGKSCLGDLGVHVILNVKMSKR